MAGGGDLGDIVELSFEQFQVGELVSPGGCSGAYMQIVERNVQASSSGGWCGQAVSIPVYYSETNNLTVLLTMVARDDDVDTRFKFALKFRYLSKQDAVTRYGPSYAQFHRGEWIPSSVCDRSFQDCDSQPCKVHSPNFPGLYPRNVTCLFRVTQRTIPRGKHAFVVVQQRNEDKLGVKDDQSADGSLEIAFRQDKKLLFGDSCSHDYIKVYDGADVSSPVLAKFCRSGALTPIVSSGPEMVIEFHTTTYDLLDMYSFELDVEVIFSPENDVGLRMIGQKCEWTIYADEQRSGVIHSLRHLAAPNTSCSYIFNGRKNDVVWLYFVKHFVDKGGTESYDRLGSIVGELYDGNPVLQQLGVSRHNVTLLAAFDDDAKLKLCVHAKYFQGFIPLRPCRYPEESYLTTGPEMFLRYNFSHQFNLHYLRMEARYEFVDTFQSGEPLPRVGLLGPSSAEPWPLDGVCNRIFHSRTFPEGVFTSPKNVFFFGRGGRRSLRCSYKFVGTESEIIRFTFLKIRLGNRKCDTVQDHWSRRYVCRPHYVDKDLSGGGGVGGGVGVDVADVRVFQVLHGRVEMPVACLCRLTNHKPLTLELMANVAYVNFTVTGMTSLEDFNSFYFEASFQFLSNPHCNSGNVLEGDGGEVSVVATNGDLLFKGPTKVHCPWLLQDDAHRYGQLKIPGTSSSEDCKTNNSIVVFTPDDLEPLAVVCPAVVGPMDSHHQSSTGSSSGSRGPISSGGGGGSGGGPPPSRTSSSSNNNVASGSTGGVGSGSAFSGHPNIPGEVEVYTKSWNNTPSSRRLHSNSLIVEFHFVEPGRFYFKWARVTKPPNSRVLGRKSRSEECQAKCPDGSTSCGSSSSSGGSSNSRCDKKSLCSTENGNGDDGSLDNCVSPAQFPWLYVGIGIGCGVLVTMILVASLLHRRRETKAKKGKPVPTDDYPMDGKENDC